MITSVTINLILDIDVYTGTCKIEGYLIAQNSAYEHLISEALEGFMGHSRLTNT